MGKYGYSGTDGLSYSYPEEDPVDYFGVLTDPELSAGPKPELTVAGSNPTSEVGGNYDWNDPYAKAYESSPQFGSAIQGINTGLQESVDRRSKLQQQLESPEDFDYSKVLSQALVGILPVLGGYALGGKEGLGWGGEAALAGEKVYLTQEEMRKKRADELAKEQLATEDKRYQALQGQKASLTSAELARASNYDRDREKFQGQQDMAQTNSMNQYNVQHQLQQERIAAGAYRGGQGGQNQSSRLEVKAVQDEFNKIAGKARDQISALDSIETMLQNPTNLTAGALRIAIARASGEVGNLAQQEQQQAMPSTLYGSTASGLNYMTGGTGDVLTDSMKAAVQQYVTQKREAVLSKVSRAQGEIRERAPQLAPSLAASGQLDEVLNSLGTATAPPKKASSKLNTAVDASRYDLTDPDQYQAYKNALKGR